MKSCQIYFLLVIFLSINLFVHAGLHQRKLLQKLFSSYDPTERPVENDNENLNISIGIAIQQIVELDEKQQMLVFSGWLDMSWNDYNLKWNPSDFGNISVISVMSDKVWVPDLVLYNSAGDSFDPKSDVNAVVYSNGEVSYLPPGMFRSTCQIEIDQFPFDEQFCKLKFGSWTYDTTTVDLKNKSDSAQLDSYVENGEWALNNVLSYSEAIKYECCPTKYPFVMFVIHIRRRTLYFIFNLVFPCVLISLMSILGFCLPPDSGEKIGLEITTLLSIMFFLQLLTTIVPESSISIPKIALYFSSIMVISTLSVITNVCVLVLHHKNIKIQEPMPAWIEKYICCYLAKILWMERPADGEDEDEDDDDYSSQPQSITMNEDYHSLGNKPSKGILTNNRFKHKNEQMGLSTYQPNSILIKRENSNLSHADALADNLLHCSKSELNAYKKIIGSILKELSKLTQKIKDDDDDEAKELNWKFAAMVIDRLCMIFFIVSTFGCTVGILLTSPNFFKFK